MADPATLPERLPAPSDLERRCIALATLDALLSPEWEFRYYSFNRNWSPETGARMGSMRNGCGDDDFILFFADGTASIKGFAHECPALGGKLAIDGVFDGIPASFADFLEEPAFSMSCATFCFWYANGRWTRSSSVSLSAIAVDGSDEMLDCVVGGPESYVQYAADYFERELSPDVVARFMALEALTADLARALVEEADVDAIAEDVDEIGYPTR